MSKSLKKLIDINRLREFKNKLVGTGSAYVQTGAVDQTIAGTKTFSKPIVGSVTGSSGSCTGNAATATTATTAKACTGNAATATKLQTARTINGTAFNGTANITTANWGTARDITIADSTGDNTGEAVSVNGSAAVTLKLPATIKASLDGNAATATSATTAASATTATTAKACTGNAATATKLATARSLWGNNFDGSATITGVISGAPAIELMPAATSNIGGYLDFHYNHSTADYTSRIIESASGTLSINDVTITTGKVVTAATFNGALKGNVTGNCSGSSGSCTGNAATATKLAAKRTIALSGAATGTATGFDGSGNITIPVTSLDASKLTGTASVSTTGNATTATNATNSNAANQLQAFVNDNFTGGNHYVKAIRSSQGWSTHLWMCYNNGAKMADEVSVNYANSAGSANTANSATTATTATRATQDSDGNQINTTYSKVGHTHDDRYYTETEVNNLLKGKANDSDVVHKSGDETIAGTKTFSNGVLITNVTGLMVQNDEYTLVLRNDGSNTYLLMSDKGGIPGTWSDARPLTISNSTGVCDINGNASTATKLAAKRTIALSGAATGTATGFDGSGNITIPVTALSPSAIRAQWYAAYPDGPEAHNAMWGGRDITAAFNNGTVSEHIADGTFKDIFPGDYITKAVTIYGNGTPVTYTVNWVIADCDYWINKGDTATTVHHVAIVPQQPIFNANMNATNTTEGGYKGSVMYRSIIRASVTGGIVSAFGSDHILEFRDGITNSVDISHVSSGIPQWTGTPGWWGEWVSVRCNLMSEKMVYGAPICSAGAMDNVMATRQMSAFRLSERLINYNRQWWWLRDVVSSASFALVDGVGDAHALDASVVAGVRPFALLV